jgi:hypothetical protein
MLLASAGSGEPENSLVNLNRLQPREWVGAGDEYRATNV